MSSSRRLATLRVAIAVALTAAALVLTSGPHQTTARADTLGELNSQLGAEQARQQHLSSSLATLARLITSLDGQIRVVQSHEAQVQQELANDRAELARVQAALERERALVLKLRRRLARSRLLLSHQLVARYEGDSPDLVSVVLDSSGFNNLLEQLNFLARAEHRQQTIISITRRAKRQADSAAARLARLEARDRRITHAATLQARALAAMNALLHSKQAALQRARSAQQLALRASREHASRLRSRIAQIHAEQAAAAAAAAAQAAPASSLGASGGWAIPWPIVDCESGGQNLPPNSAAASGYYQIIPGTWSEFGGSGPAAYLTSKAEQDAVATRIWDSVGPSAWDCAAIVGIR